MLLPCRFRAVHEEVVKLDQDLGVGFSGIITDDQGALRALYASYSEQEDKVEREWCVGLPASIFEPWVRRVAKLLDFKTGNAPPPVRSVHLGNPLPLVMLVQSGNCSHWSCWCSRATAAFFTLVALSQVDRPLSGPHVTDCGPSP